MTESSRTASQTSEPASGCPFGYGEPLTHPARDVARLPAVMQGEDGLYHIRSFATAREVLKKDGVKQAGFMSESSQQSGPRMTNQPVLFAEGDHHHDMRRQTAKYFTPTSVASYGPMIADLADKLIAGLVRDGEANLDDLSLVLAVEVAAQVVGLTSSVLPGLEKRVMAFVENGLDSQPGAVQHLSKRRRTLMQTNLAAFFLLDVKPAIAARRRERRDDLISHLIDRNYSDTEIVTECLTYATAGMVTTREFISAAAWHLLQHPELRADYVHGTEKERHAILHEILRLEPVVRTLYRRTGEELTLDGQTIPAGSVLALHITAANTDPDVVGDPANALCPMRPLPRGVQAPVLAFGDGHHRCPGAFLAIRESDVFLRRLLIWKDVEIVTPPTVETNETVKGYEIRNFRIRLGQTHGAGAKASAEVSTEASASA
ncbi:cytochrome P450 [Deinococcus arenicola]|uniref:Cytochrome P450 n=1 Tax=Deinococcus arenicola TaxID=2994950 RepID=A0ABU4DQD5_9DEIO|nr:cytochrome P450 [Deinococcus sp. ZS9-10]MDV6374182.1 cytochrome P450 [Deinococcus sp. ZS9-10]